MQCPAASSRPLWSLGHREVVPPPYGAGQTSQRPTQRLAIINAGNVFLEHYMRRRMHPDNLKVLADDPNLDVDEYMEAYVATL